MKLHTLLIGSVLLRFLTGCGPISNSQNDDPPSEWEKTTQVALLDWKSNPNSLGQLLDNCVAYTRHSYQKNVCMSLKRQVAQGFLPSDFQDNLNKVAFDFPRMAKTLDKVDASLGECMLSGDFARTFACGQISRSEENFSNGRMSDAEFVREISPWIALIRQSNSQPSWVMFCGGVS